MSGKRTLGTCSICGGAVTVPIVFHSTVGRIPRMVSLRLADSIIELPTGECEDPR